VFQLRWTKGVQQQEGVFHLSTCSQLVQLVHLRWRAGKLGEVDQVEQQSWEQVERELFHFVFCTPVGGKACPRSGELGQRQGVQKQGFVRSGR
jgi:hypothetical protein